MSTRGPQRGKRTRPQPGSEVLRTPDTTRDLGLSKKRVEELRGQKLVERRGGPGIRQEVEQVVADDRPLVVHRRERGEPRIVTAEIDGVVPEHPVLPLVDRVHIRHRPWEREVGQKGITVIATRSPRLEEPVVEQVRLQRIERC